ncbi:MAG: nucleoid-associated protein YejK [Cellvibrionaceae bacterium]|jgi:nucleoid-associated protein YejK
MCLATVSDYTENLLQAEAFKTKKYVVDYCLDQSKAGKFVIIAELTA